MYHYHQYILCVEAAELISSGIMSKSNYDSLKHRGHLNLLQRGGNGRVALVEFNSIPMRFKEQVVVVYGQPFSEQQLFKNKIQPDPQAVTYYSTYKLDDGRSLPNDKQLEYRANAEILNTVKELLSKRRSKRNALGGKLSGAWPKICQVIAELNTNEIPHSLPQNERRLRDRYNAYIKGSYSALIHKGYSNSNSRKVGAKLERLLLSLYCLPNKIYTNNVLELYMQFLGGSIDIADVNTGELFNRHDFFQDGVPIYISEATVWNYLRDPKNAPILNKVRNGSHDFSHKQRPHVNRTAPLYSLSKISMDDRDIMHSRTHAGKKVMAYYAFDDLSQALIGYSHDTTKSHSLFTSCLQNMFQFLHKNDMGTPMQVELEHHLTRDFKDGLLKAQNVFPFVYWCAPANSQEKRAERLIGLKKYGVEKRNNKDVGRHYSRLDANRTNRVKIFDETNESFKTHLASYDEIVANEVQEINDYNNELHSDQKRFKGMTRLDVLKFNLNPALPKRNEEMLARYIGSVTRTSIRRNQYAQVQGVKFQLPHPTDINKLKPNNYKVEAYYMDPLNIERVYVFQGDEFIATCEPVPTFNRANAEWTDADKQGFKDATKYVQQFDAELKKDKANLSKIAIIPVNDTIDQEVQEYTPQIIPKQVQQDPTLEELEEQFKDIADNAKDSL